MQKLIFLFEFRKHYWSAWFGDCSHERYDKIPVLHLCLKTYPIGSDVRNVVEVHVVENHYSITLKHLETKAVNIIYIYIK